MAISIKISEDNYKMLCSISGLLRSKYKRPVSLNDALSHLVKNKKVSDLAGAWKMSDKERDNILNNLKKGWNAWKSV